MKNTCPICLNKKVINLAANPNYLYCQSCMVAWLKKKPRSVYKKDYYQGKASVFCNIFEVLMGLFHTIRRSYVQIQTNSLWIDVGAGEGNFLASVKSNNRIGVEISEAGRKLMSDKGLKTMTPEQFLSGENSGAAVISFWHVLEHLDNPKRYLLAAKKNLAKGGKIIVAVPNINSFEFNFFGQDWFHLAPNYHIWHFSPTSLTILLNDCGLEIEKIDYWSLEHHIAGILQSFINKSSGSNNVLHQILRRKDGAKNIKMSDFLWCVFWLSLGLPVIILVWFISSLMKRSGSFIMVASLQKKNKG